MIPPRCRVGGALVLLAAAFAGCRQGPPPCADPPTRLDTINQSLARAADYLAGRQDPDGAWRSDLYGPFKDGPSLTPLVLVALHTAPYSDRKDAAVQRGQQYLAAMARPDGGIDPAPHGLTYPVYTASLAVSALRHPDPLRHPEATEAWEAYLRERQLTEKLGWDPSDKPYGGWGYCGALPRKPRPGEGGPPLLESNLSATVFALHALRAGGCPADDPALKAALVFLKRCQNYSDDPAQRDPAFDDSGFFFIYDDPVRNKAGAAGKDKAGRERFYSYGSTTADGLCGLLACGLPLDDPRVVAACGWLQIHFDVTKHPGTYAPDRESSRDSVYYYYCWSLARALDASGVRERAIDGKPGKVIYWAELLADELIRRQRDDGSWASDALAQRENDPLVATSQAAAALGVCRTVLSRRPENGR
jgi:squalene-hopene/tetraprenyl-beta-curcumene cyclase